MRTSDSSSAHGRITTVLMTTLDRLAADASRPSDSAQDTSPKATLGQLLDALDARAFSLMILLLALPCCIPGLWGIPQIVALPMLALIAQLASGRAAPWLPAKLSARDFEVGGMQKMVGIGAKYLGWLERLAAERLTFLTEGVGLRIVAALMLIPAGSILVPLPLTNTVPGVGVAISAVGLLERDGLIVLLGLLIGLAWVVLLIFGGAEAVSFLKDFILQRGEPTPA